MSRGVDPRTLLPRRFVLRPGVVSPLTCRHPRHVRCNCHGDFPQSGVSAPAKPAAPRSKKDAVAATSARRNLELYYEKIIAQLLFAVREFPEAAKRVAELLESHLQCNPAPPQEGYV